MNNPEISVIIPSQSRIDHLQPLFRSLKEQSFEESAEILLCAANASDHILNELPKLPKQYQIKILPSSATSISDARNEGLKNAKGKIYFFVDEDCYLPNKNYLSSLTKTISKSKDYCGGGFYITPKSQNYTTHGYNYICNFWLQRHIIKDDCSTLLLGGCAFYPAEVIRQSNARFPEDCPRSGEEYLFNQQIQAVAPLKLTNEWSVFHAPAINFKQFCSKAWTQGKTLNQAAKHKYPKSTYKAIKHNPRSFFIYLPLMLTFFVLGRTAYLYSQLR